MARAFLVAVSLFAAFSPVLAVTPVEKVITLLEDLKTQVEAEGQAEAQTYDKFACFCKSTSTEKSTAITEGRDNIDSFSADISEKTANKVEKAEELTERKAKHEQLEKDLADETVRFQKAQTEYEATAADLSKAISSLDSAIKAMEASKPVLLSVRKSVEKSLGLADALGVLAAPKRQAVSNFLQTAVDPSDPTYKYHSEGIIETLKTLLGEFRDEKSTLDTEWGKTKKNAQDTIKNLGTSIDTNDKAMGQLDTDIGKLLGEIATTRESLVNAEATLKDDQLYMKDLTKRCEVRAKDWDQRSQMRADELAALSGALEVIKGNVSAMDTAANERALLQKNSSAPAAATKATETAKKVVEAAAKKVSVAPHKPKVALLQDSDSRRGLRGRAVAAASTSRGIKAADILRTEGKRLHSEVLTALSAKVAADPFGKVKTLIQQLIERLLAESTAEATKKGFCDENLGKARKDRDYRQQDIMDLNVELKDLELKQSELEEEIDLLKDGIKTLKSNLNQTETDRDAEHDDNLQTMANAKDGLEAVTKALTILKVFYKNAAKAQSLLQVKAEKASPVDEDTSGAGFSGNYAGKQEASKGIIGMLEVIKSDFERTLRTTEASEKKAAADFVEFERVSKSDISGKETKQELDEEDLVTTKNTIKQKMADLKTASKLLDSALQTLEDLKPTCIDTGMSYADRVAKREEEMTALKTALCILDTDSVEAECQK